MNHRYWITSVAILACSAALHGATVTYDLVLIGNESAREVTVAPGAGVPVRLIATLTPSGSPADSDGIVSILLDMYTTLNTAQDPFTFDPTFDTYFPQQPRSPGTPMNQNNQDVIQIGASQRLGGPYTRNLGVGTPLVIGTNTLKTPTVAGSYTVTLSPSGNAGVLKAGTQTDRLVATTAVGTPITINVSANGDTGNRAPTAVATATPTSGSAPLAVSFNGSGSTDPDGDSLTYAWAFGDGGTAAGETASHTYVAGGTFTATLTVSDGKGGSNTKALTITVQGNGPPTAVVSATPTTGIAPFTVSFDGSGSTDPNNDPLTYAWNFGDGQTATGPIVFHEYTLTGTFVARLTVTDGQGAANSQTTIITVNENTPPTAVLAANPTSGNAPLTVTFSSAGSSDADGDSLTYAWDFGDSLSALGASVSHTYPNAGRYTATLIVTDTHGGQGAKSVIITVAEPAPSGEPGNRAPTAEATATPQSGNAPLSVAFDASASTDPDGDALDYTWDFGDTQPGTGRTASHTYITAGRYTATLIVTDGKGGSSAKTLVITVNANPKAAFTATPTSGNVGTTVNFDATASTDADGDTLAYAWKFGDGGEGAGRTTSHTYATAGIFTAILTITDGKGGSGAKALPITINDPPKADASADPLRGNVPLTVNFNAAGSSDADGDPLTYTWTFGDGQTATGLTASHTYAGGGTFTATLTVADGRGGPATRSFTVVANTPPTASIFVSPRTGTAPLSVSCAALGSFDADGDALTYLWTFGDGQTSANDNVVHTYANAGTFALSLKVTDGRGGEATASATVTVNTAPTTDGASDGTDNGTDTPSVVPFCGAGIVEAAAACLLALRLAPGRFHRRRRG